MQAVRYRSIWISDIHLGIRESKTGYLLDFLEHTESDYLYLVGDIIDIWKAKQDGRRFLVLHGDEFDYVTMSNRWLAVLGSEAYDALLRANR